MVQESFTKSHRIAGSAAAAGVSVLLMAYLVFGMLIGIATVVGMLRAPTEH